MTDTDDAIETLRGDLLRGIAAHARKRRRAARLVVGAGAVFIALVAVLIWPSGTERDLDLAAVGDQSKPAVLREIDSPLSPRYEAAIAATESSVLIWGGRPVDSSRDGPGGPDDLDDGIIYNTSTELVEQMPPSPLGAASEVSAIATSDSTILICCYSGLAEYDIVDRAWQRLADPPHLGVGGVAIEWTGSSLVAAANDLVGVYDPALDQWTTVATPAPLGSSPGPGLAVLDGAVYSVDALGETWLALDLSTSTWTELQPPEGADSIVRPAVTATSDGIYVLGPARSGQLIDEDVLTSAFYRPESGDWTVLDRPLPPPKPSEGNIGSVSAAALGDRIAVWAGTLSSTQDQSVGIVISYAPTSGTWSTIATGASPLPGRLVLTLDKIAVILLDGRLFVADRS